MPSFPRVAWVALALLASCATTPEPIPVSGGPADLSQLAGEWSGDYHASGPGRQGTIAFRLAAGADSAYGDVLMFPQERSGPAAGETRSGATPPTQPQSLRISFVHAAGGAVSGRLEPYTDPDCGCRVQTVFEGRLRGDVIEGRYVSVREGASSLEGEWRVQRRKN